MKVDNKVDNQIESESQIKNFATNNIPTTDNIPIQAPPSTNRAKINQRTPKAKNNASATPPTYEQIGMFNDKLLPTQSPARARTTDERKLRKVKELSVFTFAKQMAKYVFQCTKNAPKTYRWSVVAKMQAIAFDFIEKLYNANANIGDTRLSLQIKADAKLKLLALTAEIAKDMTIISAHQFKTLSKHMLNCKKTLWGWIKCKK